MLDVETLIKQPYSSSLPTMTPPLSGSATLLSPNFGFSPSEAARSVTLVRKIPHQETKIPPVGVKSPLVSDLATGIPPQILVADDDTLGQMYLTHLLARLGYRADVANNGREVIKLIREKHYNLLFLDLHLPEMNGLEVAQYVRQYHEAATSPFIVAVTASIAPQDRALCLEIGMNDYMTKPVRLESLQTIIAGGKPAYEGQTDTAQTSPVTEVSVLDLKVLNELKAELEGAPQVVAKLLGSYPLTATRLMEQAKEAALARDNFQLLLAVHSLYSPSATYGLMRVAGLCRELEKLAQKSSADTPAAQTSLIETRLGELEVAFKEGVAALKAHS